MKTTFKEAFAGFTLAALAVAAPLAQAVDGVVLVTQARALAGGVTPGDAPGFPVTISQPGSYRLASNLTVTTPNVDAIFVSADDVTIDLNGFTVSGPGRGNGTGTGIASDQTDLPGGGAMTVMNGTVRDMGGAGIAIDSSAIIDKVKSVNNGGPGIFVTTAAHITHSQANGNAGHGIRILSGEVIASNSVANNGDGIFIEIGTGHILDNVVERNHGAGIRAMAVIPERQTGYARNAISGNDGGAVTGTLVDLGQNMCDGQPGCP